MGLLFIGIIFMVASLIAGWLLRSKFDEYAHIPLRSGLSGKDIAEKMLRDNGIYDVRVISVPGKLTDHYNPMDKTVNLSPEVYSGRSISSAAVAAHECGHAVQHATAYKWLDMRSKMVPALNVSNGIMNFVFIGSMFLGGVFGGLFHWDSLILIIIAAQTVITVFSLVTLPVEFDATRRGLAWLNSTGLTVGEEHTKAVHALRLAAMTYVISALYALSTLIYFILRYLGNRD